MVELPYAHWPDDLSLHMRNAQRARFKAKRLSMRIGVAVVVALVMKLILRALGQLARSTVLLRLRI